MVSLDLPYLGLSLKFPLQPAASAQEGDGPADAPDETGRFDPDANNTKGHEFAERASESAFERNPGQEGTGNLALEPTRLQ